MVLSPFQLIGIGLTIALVLIPIVRFFWKKFDLPSKFAMEAIRRDEIESREIEIWGGIENRHSIIESQVNNTINPDESTKIVDKVQAEIAWSKLGINDPLKPVERAVSDSVALKSEKFREPEKESSIEAPDWELIEKMSKLSTPIQGVPSAPDLDSLES